MKKKIEELKNILSKEFQQRTKKSFNKEDEHSNDNIKSSPSYNNLSPTTTQRHGNKVGRTARPKPLVPKPLHVARRRHDDEISWDFKMASRASLMVLLCVLPGIMLLTFFCRYVPEFFIDLFA